MERDFTRDPYDARERRVAEYLWDLGVGGGDDPVGFLIASHAEIARVNRVYRERLRGLGLPTDRDDDVVPAPAP